MSKNLTKTGITSNGTIESWHVTQSIDAFMGTEAYNINLSGSFSVTGSSICSGSFNLTGSLNISRSNDGQNLLTLTSDGSTILSSKRSAFNTLSATHTFDGGGTSTFTFIGDANPYLIWNTRGLGETLNIGGSVPTITTTRPALLISSSLLGIGFTDYNLVQAKTHIRGNSNDSTSYSLIVDNLIGSGSLRIRDNRIISNYITGSSITGSILNNNEMTSYLDESNNKLIFLVKYSNGTVKSGSVDLI